MTQPPPQQQQFPPASQKAIPSKAQPQQLPPPQQPQFEWDKVVYEFANWHPANESELAYFRDAH